MTEQQLQQEAEIKLALPRSLQTGNAITRGFCTGKQSGLEGQKSQLHLKCIIFQQMRKDKILFRHLKCLNILKGPS